MKRKVLLGFLALVVTVSQSGALEAQQNRKYLVQFKHGIPANVEALVAKSGGTVQRVHPQIGYVTVSSADAAFSGRMARRGEVAAVYNDVKLQLESLFDKPAILAPKAAATSSDPTDAALFPCQWQLDQIDAPEAWDRGALGSPAAKVAILDTGVDPTHVDLEGRVDEVNSTSLLPDGSSACGDEDEDSINDLAGHGTFMASMVTTNGINIAAVAPNTQVVAIKIFNCQGQGEFSDIIAGILHAADIPDVSAISMSIGGFIDRRDPGAKPVIRAVRDAVQYAVSKGKLVVSVAGNQHVDLRFTRPVAVPTESGEAIGVYATDVRDQLASYSNWGFPASWIGAPGGDNLPPKHPFAGCPLPVEQQGRILGACSSFVCDGAKDQYITGRGTSISAPIVAAVGALVDGEANGAIDGRRIKVILKNRADDLGEPGTDPIYGHGRVNAGRAVNH